VAIIDDEEPIREAVSALLRSFGFAVAAFGSAEEFLAWDRRRMTFCAILDLYMPGMNGLELQQRLKRDRHRISIVFLTGYDDEKARARALAAGALAFLKKPFDPKVLRDLVKSALEK